MEKFDDEDFIQYSDKKVKEEKSELTAFFFVHITLYILLIFFAIFFVWFTVFDATHGYYAVKGASMKNALNASLSLTDSEGCEDGVYVDKKSDAKLYDIVVARHYSKSAGKEINVVKRLMATAGDYISVALYDDGENSYFYFYRIAAGTNLENFTDEQARLEENGENGYQVESYERWTHTHTEYTYNGVNYEEHFFDTFLIDYTSDSDDYFTSNSGMIYVKVPEGMCFCMGDNRAYSEDSRSAGFFETSEIVGRVEIIVRKQGFFTRIWTVVEYYFGQVEEFFAR